MSPTLAVVGEAGPEVVIPLSNIPGGAGVVTAAGNVAPLTVSSPVAGSAGGGGGQTVNVYLTMQGAVYGDINEALNAMGRQLATVLLPAAGTRMATR